MLFISRNICIHLTCVAIHVMTHVYTTSLGAKLGGEAISIHDAIGDAIA